jgi:formate hydrogenlyase subunit 3/multisubunit Na+/H+ antiporter MnhD subunit
MSAVVLFFVVPLLPVLVAPLLFTRAAPLLLPIAPWIPLSALLLLPWYGQIVELPWLLLGTRLGIDGTALPLVLLATVAWTVAGWHARQHIAADTQARFFFAWLLTWCGNLSVFLALDGASFYAAYAMMTFSAYGLVVFMGRPEDFRAGRVYLTMAVVGEGMLLSAVLLLGIEAGNPDLTVGPALVASTVNPNIIGVLMLAGFGVKMGLIGLHMWLPLAHPQAPVPASAVLSGVILKAGLIGWLRYLPHGQDGFELLGLGLLSIGFVTAFFGAVVGITQSKLKSLLAYSSVSQMGLIAAIVALALLDPAEAGHYVAIATLFALHHGLAKCTLFLAADLVHTAPVVARRLLWIPAAALAGLPLTSGALAKAAWKGALPLALNDVTPLLIASSVLTTLLMARMLVIAWPRDKRSASGAWPWIAMLTASLVLPWAYAAAITPAFVTTPFQPAYLIETAAPVVAGVIAALLVWRWGRARRWFEVPPGDVLALLPTLPRMRAVPPFVWPRPRWGSSVALVETAIRDLAPALLIGTFLVVVLALLAYL